MLRQKATTPPPPQAFIVDGICTYICMCRPDPIDVDLGHGPRQTYASFAAEWCLFNNIPLPVLIILVLGCMPSLFAALKRVTPHSCPDGCACIGSSRCRCERIRTCVHT